MITYTDQLIKIEILETDGILCVHWPETDNFQMSDFELSFHILMQKIEEYGVKKFIWYANKTYINLPEEDYRSVVSLLQSGLAHAGVKKVARIFIDRSEKDLKCLSIFKEILTDMQLKLEIRDFEDQESAIAWLKN